jgi:hypothetical protein
MRERERWTLFENKILQVGPNYETQLNLWPLASSGLLKKKKNNGKITCNTGSETYQ